MSLDTPRNEARDTAILDRLARADADAVADLYDRHGRAVYSLVLRMLQDEIEAAKVTHDVFAEAWETASRYRPLQATVPAWLLSKARERALARLRGDKRARGAGAHSSPTPAATADGPVEPMRTVPTLDERKRIERELGALPPLQRLAIEAAYFDGLDRHEVARRLDLPIETVAKYLVIGMMQLRAALRGTAPVTPHAAVAAAEGA